MRRRLQKPLDWLLGAFGYYTARLVVWLLSTFYWRIEYEGRENVPTTGAFLLSPVHRSNVDGPITCVFTRRRMRYLAKEGMFTFKPTAKLYSEMGAIPVNRGTPDRHSLHRCIEVLSQGWPLVLFPEGTRRDGPKVEDLHEGAAYIALRAGVPIVPVGIGNSERANPRGTLFLRPVKIRVIIGEPMYLPKPEGDRVPRSAVRSGTAQLQERLQQLFDRSEGREAS